MKEEILKKLSYAIAEGETDEGKALVKEAIAAGVIPLEILNDGASKGMDSVNERYNEGEAFLPELIVSGDTMTDVIALIFESMNTEEIASTKLGSVVIGQAKGDVHDIGIDVPVKSFIEKQRK